MDWFWHNPIADMRGPTFLALYAAVSALTIAACALAARLADWTGSMPPAVVPAEPDPYEIAFLRGGENEVTRSAIFSLIKKQHLSISRQGKKFLIERLAQQAARPELSIIERRVYDWFDRPRETGEVFKSGGLSENLRGLCAAYGQKLTREKLMTPPEVSARARLVRLAGLAVIAGLGGYKLLAALSKGRTNVLFLILIGLAAAGFLFLFTRAPRLSRRGKTYLERLKLAFERLKNGSGDGSQMGEYSSAVSALTADAPGVRGYAPDPALMALSVFGAGALVGADYDNYSAAFKHSAASSSSGSSCGSGCGSSSDSSSGGDGGGGSSSCGGGGCGGCGGGD